MSSPIERTLDTLSRSQEPAALTILNQALDREDEIGVAAAASISRHGNRRAKTEVVRRIAELSAGQKNALKNNTEPFAEIIDFDLDGTDTQLRYRAIDWVRHVVDFAFFTKLVERLAHADDEELPYLTQTLEELTDRMYDHIVGADCGTPDCYSIRNADEIRASMFEALVTAFDQLEQQPCPERLVEWALIIGDYETPAVARLFSRSSEVDTKRISTSLLTSVHPGILRLPMEMMKRNFPFDAAFEVFATRVDEPFVHSLIRDFPATLDTAQKQNLSQITSLPWLTGHESELEPIPSSLHQRLVKLVSAFGLPEELRQKILRWLLKNGDRETRDEAADYFGVFDESESHDILIGSLEHDDADVQVWATSHLRGQKVPDAFALLIQRLDSDVEEVREAARQQLSDLNLRRALEMMETTPDRVTPSFGELLLKINPDLCLELRREYAHPIRSRRVNAMRTGLALGLAEETISGIAALVQDSDMLVRRTAVEILAETPVRESVTALVTATGDRSPRVQQAAVQALKSLKAKIASEEVAGAESATNEPSQVTRETSAADNLEPVE